MTQAPMLSSAEESAFRAFERARHDQVAETYRDFFAPVTVLAIDPLLDAAEVSAGCRLLDVACGPGVATARAAAQGVAIGQFSHTHRVASIDAMWAGSMGSFARTCALVLAQTPEMQQRIHAAYDRLAGGVPPALKR